MTESIIVGGHRRIRPFNTADTYPEQRLSNDRCQAVVAGHTILLLSEAGAKLEHVVTCDVYLTDIRHREPVYRVLGERMRGVYPCFTGLVVQALARPEWLVEVTAVAVKP